MLSELNNNCEDLESSDSTNAKQVADSFKISANIPYAPKNLKLKYFRKL